MAHLRVSVGCEDRGARDLLLRQFEEGEDREHEHEAAKEEILPRMEARPLFRRCHCVLTVSVLGVAVCSAMLCSHVQVRAAGPHRREYSAMRRADYSIHSQLLSA